MTTPANSIDIRSLIERVEAAKGADREIDARVHVALFPDEPGMVFPGSPNGIKGSRHAAIREMDWTAWDRLTLARGENLGEVADHHAWPAYTASVDTALALIERARPGWNVLLDTRGPHARIYKLGNYPDFGALGRTPALAACLALLRAIEARALLPETKGATDGR